MIVELIRAVVRYLYAIMCVKIRGCELLVIFVLDHASTIAAQDGQGNA